MTPWDSAGQQVDEDVPVGHYADESMRATVVPNRNAIMLALATGIAANSQRPRRVELEAAGLVVDSGRTAPTMSQSLATLWTLAPGVAEGIDERTDRP